VKWVMGSSFLFMGGIYFLSGFFIFLLGSSFFGRL
jgi:hypothetical protein